MYPHTALRLDITPPEFYRKDPDRDRLADETQQSQNDFMHSRYTHFWRFV
jgi:hypothetical protein